MIVDGWQVDRLHYADDSGLTDTDPHVPGAFIELVRADQGRYGIYIPDDGKAFSHRALISSFRECPHIWKHRSAERIHLMAQDIPMATPGEHDGWTPVVDPFPGALIFSPATLRGVTAIDQTRVVGDVTIVLTTLERYRDGARLRFLAQSPEIRKRKNLQLVGIEIIDSHGRTYTSALLNDHHDANRVEGAYAIGPAIPTDTEEITITVAALGDPKEESEATPGPWIFHVQLGLVAPVYA
ncbi:MAG: hypothetical protein EXQ74_06120 [Thermoleophilia bacterium]|nr:hypothetical protein [Thermoleophilia bacterium]